MPPQSFPPSLESKNDNQIEKPAFSMKFFLLLAGSLFLTSCGAVLEYRTESGVLIQEKIDGKLNPTISAKTLLINDYLKR